MQTKGQFLSELKAAFSFTPTPIVSLTVCRNNVRLDRPRHERGLSENRGAACGDTAWKYYQFYPKFRAGKINQDSFFIKKGEVIKFLSFHLFCKLENIFG